ncbi:hypothetical protein ACFVH6_22010 [Spirillospora sp. NPDC127200]
MIRWWRRWCRPRYATGGALPARNGGADTIPIVVSPGRSTTRCPGETHIEAMERLTEGEDL